MSEEQQHRLALPPGTRIREFEFHRVLGQGGFGITYLGRNVALDISVAIKEYLPSDLATREQDLSVVPQAAQSASDFRWGLERFLDEARILARLQHPNIVRVHHFFEAHSTAYIAMDYVEGEDLSAHLKGKGTLSEDELTAILHPLLSALEVVHSADFLHRDIKPGNIILRAEDSSPVLLDFGAARQAMGAKSRSVTSIVTPGYAPIEQYSSRGRQGAWTDIYALGGVCYRALTGQAPDDATDRVRNDPLVPVSQQCAGRVNGAFLSSIDAALAVDEGDRLQSVGAWRAAMETDARGEPVVRKDAAPANKKKKAKSTKSKRLAMILGVVAVLIMGGIAIALQEQAALEKKRQEQQAELERQQQEQAALKKKRQEQQAELERQRLEQAALEKKRQEQQAELERQRQEQAVLEKKRQEQQAELEKQRQEQAASEKKQQEQQAVLEKAGAYSLHDAASKNAHEAAEVLLKQGADINAQDKQGWTPLHHAAWNNAAATAEVLLKQGADIHATNKNGWTPLHWGALNNAADTAEVLLKNGANVNAKNKDGDTPLHHAARNSNYITAEVLLKNGANVNAKNENGNTPLHWAERENMKHLLRRYDVKE